MKKKNFYAAILILSFLLAGVQPSEGTIFIPADTSVGTWDPVTRTYTLTTDVYETIEIDEDNLTLDGTGHTVSGPGSGNGVYLNGRTDVTIQNLNVQGFRWGIYLYESSGNALTDNTASNNFTGIYLNRSSNNTLTGNTANSNNSDGITLGFSSNNTLTGNTANSNNGHGISLHNSSNHNTLTGNAASTNSFTGIYLMYCNGSTLTDNTATSNDRCGIILSFSSDNILTANTVVSNQVFGGIVLGDSSDNTLTDNTASNNDDGINLHRSSGNTLTGNSMLGNRYNFRVSGVADAYYANSIDTSNTVDGKPVYYVVNGVGGIYDSSTNAGVFYAINCNGITIKDLLLTNNYEGVYLWNTHNSSIENVGTSNNGIGIYLRQSTGNNLTVNTVNWNDYDGICLGDSSDNTLTGNTVSWNSRYGIRLWLNSNGNQICNNNFIGNTTQAFVNEGVSGNLFNLAAPIGGNFWSNWTSPDANGDGFVDYPYIFTGGQDNLPWTGQDGWLTPRAAIRRLIAQVVALNLPKGIENSLNAKLQAAVRVLSDDSENKTVAAIRQLQAFINAVEFQRGKKISEAPAYALITAAQEIIALLSGA